MINKIIRKILPSFIETIYFHLYIYYNKILNYKNCKISNFFNIVEIETITKCNRKCTYCPNYNYDRGNHLMDEKLFKKIIDDLSEIKYKGRIRPHFYGESLLDKRLPYLMEYTRKKLPHSRIEIFTNGDLLTTDLFNKLINAGVNYFKITQHGELMSKKISELFGYIKKNPNFKKKIGYENFNSGTILVNRGGLISYKNTKKFKRCKRQLFSVVIDYRGNLILCCNDYLSSVIFGNLKKENLIYIWNKPSYKKIRENIKKGKLELDICKKCGQFSL